MSDRTSGLFATVTHARLRLRQGDVREARRILSGILDRNPEDSAARELLAELGAGGRPFRKDSAGTARPMSSGQAARRFRRALGVEVEARREVIERLEEWLRRVRRNTGDAHA